MGFTSEKLHVFVSYSRDDLDFADQLAAGLRVGGIDPTIDRQGISGGEDWRRRLGSLIRDAETVVFVLSPSSARSETCGWEVEEAARLGKRIVPVVCRPLENAAAPPRLQSLNYVFFYAEPKSPGSGFGSGLEQLIAALNTDIDWLREHTRYLQRATEWDAGGRPENRLLSGADITVAKAWAARRPKGAPEPTTLHLDFILASENREAQQQSEERKRLEEIARAQEERARALADREIAQKREAEASRRAEAEARRAAEEATRAASASKTVARRTAAGLAAALVLAAIASGVGFYAFNQRQEVVAQSQVAQQALRVAVAWEYTEKDVSVSAAFLREAKEPASIRGWRGAASKTLEMLRFSSKIPLGRPARIRSAKFSPDGRRIVTASEDRTVRVWEGETGELIAVLHGHTGALSGAAFSPDGQRILTASDDHTARVWNAASGQLLATLEGHTAGVDQAAFSPDGQRIVTASLDNTARVWNSANGQLLAKLEGHTSFVRQAAFSPDGQRIVTVSDDATARVWNTANGQLQAKLLGHAGGVLQAEFSPDGDLIVTASEDNAVRIWDAGNGSAFAKLVGHTGALSGAAFSPDGQFIATASVDGTARIWDVGTGRGRAVLRHPGGPVWAASFSPDGRYLATASEDGKARLWTLNGLLDSVFNVAGSRLYSADYSPDGSRLLAVSRDGEANILTLLPKIESLQALLWKLSPSCPDAQTRTDLLGQPKAEAERDNQVCMVQIEKHGNR